MTEKDFNSLNVDFLDAATKLFYEWTAKHGLQASLICSFAIHAFVDVPEDIADVDPDGDDKFALLYSQTREIETDGVKKNHSFPQHARSLIKALDEYRDEEDGDFE